MRFWQEIGLVDQWKTLTEMVREVIRKDVAQRMKAMVDLRMEWEWKEERTLKLHLNMLQCVVSPPNRGELATHHPIGQ